MKNSLILILLSAFAAVTYTYPLESGDSEASDFELVDDMLLPARGIGGLSARKRNPWPQGVMPYTIDIAFQLQPKVLANIRSAINTLNSRTCVTLRPKTASDRNWIHYQPHSQNANACNSNVGFIGGKQVINLGNSATSFCVRPGTIMHETMHAMGFVHEHMRDDRDDYVYIDESQLSERDKVNYEKTSEFYQGEEFDSYGEPYDYESIMHYPPGNIISVVEGSGGIGDPDNMGQRDHITDSDVAGINKHYEGSPGCSKIQ